MQSNYPLTVNFRDLMQRRQVAPCSLGDSVREHVFLLLTTRFGECSHDATYGCELWEYDFDHPGDLDAQKHRLEKSIKTIIEGHEPRLTRVSIKVTIDTQLFVDRFNKEHPVVKKKITIAVKGVLKETNQEFQPAPPYVIYFSPVSVQR
jgi:phage baseplate assembly protein W